MVLIMAKAAVSQTVMLARRSTYFGLHSKRDDEKQSPRLQALVRFAVRPPPQCAIAAEN
jgi:hypothetical protein